MRHVGDRRLVERRQGRLVIADRAITIQNVPEGTATAAAMQPAGYSAAKQFWGAVLTSVPQVPGALVAWFAVEQTEGFYRPRLGSLPSSIAS